jgi:hypothetical protein
VPPFLLDGVVPSVVMLDGIMLSVVMLDGIILSVVMLDGIVLSVIAYTVYSPLQPTQSVCFRFHPS